MEIGDQPSARRRKTLAAEPEDFDVRLSTAQRLDQRARVQIARGFAARQQNARALSNVEGRHRFMKSN